MYLSIDQLRKQLRNEYSALTWEEVAFGYGVDKAVVYRIATSDYEPKDNAIRAKLHLAPICQKCGELVDIG